ncbi:MAG: helix-turn-helix domain-containing protein [Aggregatilineales bacterium]
MTRQTHPIPYVSLEEEVGRSFDIRPIQRDIDPEDLHRHSFQELLWIRTGTGEQRIDDHVLKIQKNTFYLISRGQVHHFMTGIGLDGYVLRFADDFLPGESQGIFPDYRTTLFGHFSVHHMLQPDSDNIAIVQGLMDRMWVELQQDEAGKVQMLRHLLSMLLILLERARQNLPQEYRASHNTMYIYQEFVALLETEFRQQHSVTYYARSMHLTPRQLSEIVKKSAGKSAKTLIQERIILEAKRLLRYSNASVKEIAYQLGFKDPSYFSKVFKQVEGESPSRYLMNR